MCILKAGATVVILSGGINAELLLGSHFGGAVTNEVSD